MIGNSNRLEQCPDCGKEIGSRAAFCPHCGAPRTQSQAFARPVRPDWGFEWRSRTEILGYPLVHIAFGRKDGKLRIAKGVIAIGQFAIGALTFAQFGIGFIFGFGQFILSPIAIAQFAGALIFGLGQLATGYIAIGQLAVGYYGLGQLAVAVHGCMPKNCSPEAREYFLGLWQTVKSFFESWF